MAVTVMEKVPEAVEHYNRITTAIATYNLSKGNIVATVDAVQATQFNYDTGNRARLLKALPGGGGRALITPIMMFKTYGIGIARLLYGAMFDVVYKKGGRLEAAKLASSQTRGRINHYAYAVRRCCWRDNGSACNGYSSCDKRCL
jgi:hypothetical protein